MPMNEDLFIHYISWGISSSQPYSAFFTASVGYTLQCFPHGQGHNRLLEVNFPFESLRGENIQKGYPKREEMAEMGATVENKFTHFPCCRRHDILYAMMPCRSELKELVP